MALVDRAKNILINPRAEWQVIDAEQTSVGDLFRGYAVPLALIPAVCSLIGFAWLGVFHYSMAGLIVSAFVRYVLALVGVYVLGLVIDALAPSFGGAKNPTQAMKVAVYSSTAGWVGGIFLLVPFLGILGLLLAIYGLYLLWLGLPVLMRAPADRATTYTVVVVLVMIAIYIVIGMIAASVMTAGFLLS
jgi:hypothetical protein